jgi:guanylate kinase
MAKLVHVGLGNFLAADRIVAIAPPNSEPIRRVMQKSREEGRTIDMTMGRRTKAVLVMDSGHIVLTAIGPEAIAGRVDSDKRSRNRATVQDEEGGEEDEELPSSSSPLLVVISGPSGAGKDSVLASLRDHGAPFYFVITATTRPKRAGEVDGVDYMFLPDEKFQELIEKDELLEHATVYNYHYGVPKEQVRHALWRGQDVIVRTDVQGARHIKRIIPEAVTIFVTPPSLEELEERLYKRGSDEEEQLALRLDMAEEEMAAQADFDYVVVNESAKLEDTVDQIEAIITSEKQRLRRTPIQL